MICHQSYIHILWLIWALKKKPKKNGKKRSILAHLYCLWLMLLLKVCRRGFYKGYIQRMLWFFWIGNSLEFCIMQGQLAKHVGCEISGRLDKIHPERENKVRSNELWLTRAVGASKPSPQMQMLKVSLLDGLLKKLRAVTAQKEGRWNSAPSLAVLQWPETPEKCSAYKTSLNFYWRGTYCTGIQNMF